ncbi:GntR family transcriptional regulator [Demequina lutea]|uniref:DNA-binding GntR family transcriptional regulator n=1 Tax=Demequina lutea TaxID=431489 RepID=A0A7Z0CJC5_9MICO|nr:GntR family transcriptional regulator [Demequina lutea]NYI42869.1 DNA-binding GntR family transcriptional regulator [Demequina lutea]
MKTNQSGPATSTAFEAEAMRPLPLHQQVNDALRRSIISGDLALGGRLPSERVLAREFGVSRVTVRQALKDLEQEGLVEAGDGLRWVARPAPALASVEEGVTGLVSFSELGAMRELTVRAKVLFCETRPSSLDEAEAIRIAPGASVHELVRLRYLEDVPVVVDHSVIPATVAPSLNDVDFTTASLYQTLASRYGCTVTRAEYALEARTADPQHAELLGLQPGEPVLEAWQTTFDGQGRVIQLCRLVYRGDRYRFRTLLEVGRISTELSRRTPAESAALGDNLASLLRRRS